MSEDRSEYIFNKLKRDGDCWHEKGTIGNMIYACIKCKGSRNQTNNPNFFNPPKGKEWELFGWLWERFRCNQFPWAEFNTWLYIQHRRSIEDLISCTALAEALEKWFKQEDDNA